MRLNGVGLGIALCFADSTSGFGCDYSPEFAWFLAIPMALLLLFFFTSRR